MRFRSGSRAYPQQVNNVFKRHIDPSCVSIVKGGDFKKVGAFQ